MKWITEGFEGFSKGTMENGGQNLYVSKKGVLQRVFQYDVNQDGYPDLLFANSQSMYERCPTRAYPDPLNSGEFITLPAMSCGAAVITDLLGSGYEDLVLACQHNGTHNDSASIIYFGSDEGYTEKYKTELPAPNATGVAVGDFNGDGKKEILFISNGKLRLFYQVSKGFGPGDLIDLDVEASNIAAADLDGDGITDLIVKKPDGKLYIFFGKEGGLDVENPVALEVDNAEEVKGSTGSTAGMVDIGTVWKPSVLTVNGVQYIFTVNGENVDFFTCSSDRKIEKAFSLHCPGAQAAAAADLTGNGKDDLAVAVYTDKDQPADCRIYLDCSDNYVTVPVIGAVNVTAADLQGNKVIFSRCGARVEQEVPSPVFSVAADGSIAKVAEVTGGDVMVIVAGHPCGKDKPAQVVVPSRTMNRKQGHEDIYVFTGGEDGYIPERRIELPGHSAVDGTMCDFFDTGKVDIMVTNCFEDAAFLDDGCYIYRNDGNNNFDKNNKVTIPTVRAHGSAIGDFRKSGYLDLAFGGFHNRQLRIFHGSEKGYSLDNCTTITLGDNDPSYKPHFYPEGAPWDLPEEEAAKNVEFGQVRWLLACDFNGDGWLDLFVSEIVGPHCFILWGGPDGFSWENRTTLMADGVASAAVADLNKNGYPDLILAQHMSTKKAVRYESYVTVYWGGPDGYQENRKMQLPTVCSNTSTVGDYNGDGNLDLYTVSYQNGRERDLLSFIYHNRDGKFSINDRDYLYCHSSCGCVSGDFNGDGYTDLAVACHKEYGNHVSHSFIFWGGPDGLSNDRKTVLPTVGPHGMSTVDPGNILNRGPKEHYTSEAFNLPAGAKVSSIAWEGECTSTSWVEVEVRCADSEAGLAGAAWQSVEAGADISGLNVTGCVQYRLALCAKCACGTPRITRVTVNY